MKNRKKLILGLTFVLMHSIIFSQVEETIIEVEEEVVEDTNVNSYYSKNTADIVTGEIDNTLLVFKGKNSSLYGLKDKNNKILVKPIFKSISTYGSTKDRIQANFGWKKNGVIDRNGNIIIPFEYSSISKNKNIYTVSTNDSQKKLLDYFGKPLLKNSYEDIYVLNSNYIKVKKNGFYGVISSAGKELLPTKYDEINYYSSQEWFLLVQNGVSTIKDVDGKNVFDKKYTSITKLDYDFRYIIAEKNGKFGIISKTEQVLAPFEFQEISKNYNNRLFITKKNDKWGVYSILFDRFIIEPQYDEVTLLSGDNYLLNKGAKKTMTNLLANTKIDVTAYDEIKKYVSYGKVKVEKNSLMGAISLHTGKTIIPIKYKYIDINSNYIRAQLTSSRVYDIYDNDGNILVKNANNIRRLNSSEYNTYRVSSNGKVGVIYKNKITVPVMYDFIESHKDLGLLSVQDKNKYGLIDTKNKAIIPLGSDKITVSEGKINWKNKKYTVSLGKLVELK